MPPVLDALLGFLLLGTGTGALVTMLWVFGGTPEPAQRERLVHRHRMLGWTFVVLYGLLAADMTLKVRLYASLTPTQALHLTCGLGLLPLLAAKLLIVRRHKPLYKLLPALGIGLFVGVVMVTGLGMYSRFLLGSHVLPAQAASPGVNLTEEGRALVEARCGRCHSLERVYSQKGRRSAALWGVTLDRMVAMDPSLQEVRGPILAYLQSELAAPTGPHGEVLSGASLVEARCSKCHALDRVFRVRKTAEEWRATVRRYGQLMPGQFRPEEVEPMVQFLSQERETARAP